MRFIKHRTDRLGYSKISRQFRTTDLQYLGFIFAQGPDFEQTFSALKRAYSRLRFVTQPRWELQQVG